MHEYLPLCSGKSFMFGPALAMLTIYGREQKEGLSNRFKAESRGLALRPRPATTTSSKLVFEIAVPDAHHARAIAEWVADLDHELGDNAMEDDAAVAEEVLHRFASSLR